MDAAAEVEIPEENPSDADVSLSQRERQYLQDIVALNAEVLAAHSEYEMRKSVATDVKRRLERLQLELSDRIAAGPNTQQELPFTYDDDDEQWQDVPISDVLTLTDKQFEKLEDAGVRTVGQFETLRSGQVDGFPDGLRSIKGVGQKTVDAWEDQIVEWLSANARSNNGDDTDAGADKEED